MKAVMSQPMNFFCRADAAGTGCAGGPPAGLPVRMPAGEAPSDTEFDAVASIATSSGDMSIASPMVLAGGRPGGASSGQQLVYCRPRRATVTPSARQQRVVRPIRAPRHRPSADTQCHTIESFPAAAVSVVSVACRGEGERVRDTLATTKGATVFIAGASDGLQWRFRAPYPDGDASRGACVSYLGTN